MCVALHFCLLFYSHCPVYSQRWALSCVQYRDGHCLVYSLEVDIVQYTVYRWTLSSLQFTDEHCPVYSLEMDIVQYTVQRWIVQYPVQRWTLSSIQFRDGHCPVYLFRDGHCPEYSLEMDCPVYSCEPNKRNNTRKREIRRVGQGNTLFYQTQIDDNFLKKYISVTRFPNTNCY